MLEDCFDHSDWDMFRVASENNIQEYTNTVTEFIRKCIGDVVPTMTNKTDPNLKPWRDGSMRANLKVRTTAFNQGKVNDNMVEYKQYSYTLHKAIKQAKRNHLSRPQLVKDHITSTLPDTQDPLQFAYRPKRSTCDAFAITPHTALSHLDKNTYVRMLFII